MVADREPSPGLRVQKQNRRKSLSDVTESHPDLCQYNRCMEGTAPKSISAPRFFLRVYPEEESSRMVMGVESTPDP